MAERTKPRWPALAVIGLGTVVYLLYTELFKIDAICLWCTAVHVLTFLVFVSTVLATLTTAPLDDELGPAQLQEST